MNKINLKLNKPAERIILDIDNLSLVGDGVEDANKTNDQTVYENIECFVKWFKPEEGFGFLKSDAIDRDIFIHCSVMDPVKSAEILPGDRMVCTVIMGQRGPQVDVIHLHVSNQITGTIKWFNTQHDYGFIRASSASGNRDVFIQGKKVRSLGIDTDKLYTDQVVSFTFRIDNKGDLVVDKMSIG